MASFRGRRVVIASLFLPNSAVLGESPPPTPELHLASSTDESSLSIPAVAQRLAEKPRRLGLTPVPSITSSLSLPAPLKSIVEDLKDKVFTQIVSSEAWSNPYIVSQPNTSTALPYTRSSEPVC